MNAIQIGIEWLSEIHDKYGPEKTVQIATGSNEVFDKLNSYDPDVRDEIIKLFLKVRERFKEEK